MSCCPPPANPAEREGNELQKFDAQVETGPWVREASCINPDAATDATLREWQLDLIVPGIHCPACISKVETALMAQPGVSFARVNFSTRRVSFKWQGERYFGNNLLGVIEALGYRAQPFDAGKLASAGEDAEGQILLRSMAIAGFAAGNVMLLSVSVWSGADFATRDLFHWLSALISLPAVAYAARPFFKSAYGALSHGRLNMDVPISLAVVLAAAVSLFETFMGGERIYFDAAITLVFFLLVGRYLDHLTRSRARSVAADLLALQGTAATLIDETGARVCVRSSDLRPGQILAVVPGERIAADGIVIEGRSDCDRSMVNGETLPEAVEAGMAVHAGTLNLSGSLRVKVTATGENTFLAEIVRLMEAAEQGRAAQVRLADKAARIYAPAVHLLAAVAFGGWMIATGDFRHSLLVAVSVLIITCPCALGLAVPAVQVAAAGALMKLGVLVKNGGALEAMAKIDTVVFDKTGTLTLGKPRLVSGGEGDARLAEAASLAAESKHPLAQALMAEALERGLDLKPVNEAEEHAGLGLTGIIDGHLLRLGRRSFVDPDLTASSTNPDDGLSELWLSVDGSKTSWRFAFEDSPRSDAQLVVGAIKQGGLHTKILSGDRQSAVARLASSLGIDDFSAGVTPDLKLSSIESLQAAGHSVLMVGDGLNDAPALAAADVSMSPSTAADISQVTAGFVFLGTGLRAVTDTWKIAKRADRLVKQNFGIAIAYNFVAVPLAMAGFATPLLAAIAMSTSSILVTANALRVGWGVKRQADASQPNVDRHLATSQHDLRPDGVVVAR